MKQRGGLGINGKRALHLLQRSEFESHWSQPTVFVSNLLEDTWRETSPSAEGLHAKICRSLLSTAATFLWDLPAWIRILQQDKITGTICPRTSQVTRLSMPLKPSGISIVYARIPHLWTAHITYFCTELKTESLTSIMTSFEQSLSHKYVNCQCKFVILEHKYVKCPNTSMCSKYGADRGFFISVQMFA